MRTTDRRAGADGDPLRGDDPQQVGPYQLWARLGEGGMGVVYLGQSPDGRQVAIKVIRPQLAADPAFRARFRREVAAARRVAPYCTAPVLDDDPDAERPYLVTEYVDGPSLQQQVAEHGPLPAWQVEGLAVGTAGALVAIHRAGVIHRDYKPSNVLLSRFGPRVIDFGIAAAAGAAGEPTVPGRQFGTLAYMAPEQQAGTSVTTAADLWAWAATVVFAATGRIPFGPADAGLGERLRRGAPDLDGLDGRLRPVVAAALAVDPHARPTAPQLLERLGRQLQQPLTEPGSVRQFLQRTWEPAPATSAPATGVLGAAADATRPIHGGAAPAADDRVWIPGAEGQWLLRLVGQEHWSELEDRQLQLHALRLLRDGYDKQAGTLLWTLLRHQSATVAVWAGWVLGNHYREQGELRLAAEAYTRAAQRADACCVAMPLFNLGHLRWAQGDYDAAEDCYRQVERGAWRCPRHAALSGVANRSLLAVLEGRNRTPASAPPAVVPEAIAYPYTWLAGHAARLWARGNAVLLFATLLVERVLVARVQVGWWYPVAWVLLLAGLVGAGMSIFRLTVRADEDRKTFGAQAVQGSPAVAVGSLTLGATLALLTVLARFIG